VRAGYYDISLSSRGHPTVNPVSVKIPSTQPRAFVFNVPSNLPRRIHLISIQTLPVHRSIYRLIVIGYRSSSYWSCAFVLNLQLLPSHPNPAVSWPFDSQSRQSRLPSSEEPRPMAQRKQTRSDTAPPSRTSRRKGDKVCACLPHGSLPHGPMAAAERFGPLAICVAGSTLGSTFRSFLSGSACGPWK
jgi:hypothetical protein